MGRVEERLAGHFLIGLDTSVFIYHFEAHPTYLGLTTELFGGIEVGKWRAITSTVALMELTVGPHQLGAHAVAAEYEARIVSFPNLAVGEVSRDVARLAASIRALTRLRSPDALVLATALVAGATAFVTNDRVLQRSDLGLDVIVLGDLTEH